MSKEHTRRHVADSRGRFILLPRLQDQQLLLPHRLLPGSHLQLLDQPLLLLLIQRKGTKFRYQRTSPGVAHDAFTLLYPLPWKAPSKTPASSLRLRRHLSSFFLDQNNHLASSTGRKHRGLLLLHQNTCFTSPSRKTPMNRPGPPSRMTRKTPMNQDPHPE